MNRRRLPNRRTGETIGFEFRGAAYSATFSSCKASLFARVKDDGRAEAALIGVAGLMREVRS